jgi:hypothetical protein
MPGCSTLEGTGGAVMVLLVGGCLVVGRSVGAGCRAPGMMMGCSSYPSRTAGCCVFPPPPLTCSAPYGADGNRDLQGILDWQHVRLSAVAAVTEHL